MLKGIVVSLNNGEGIVRDDAGIEYRLYKQGFAHGMLLLVKKDSAVSFSLHPKQKSGLMPRAVNVRLLQTDPTPTGREGLAGLSGLEKRDRTEVRLASEASRKGNRETTKHEGPSGGTKKSKKAPIRCNDIKLPFPYHFVPVSIVGGANWRPVEEPPIFHHGANPEQPRLVTGELQCTLTALTPLLVGNYQFEVKDLESAQTKGEGEVRIRGFNAPLNAAKKVIVPLMLQDGQVLISGTSLKGMVRQGIGALLAAPMERVSERTYSYRPNIVYDRDRVKWSAAKVERAPDSKTGAGMQVRLVRTRLEGGKNPFLSDPFNPQGREESEGRILRYLGGIDGQGLIHQIVNAAKEAGDANMDPGERTGDPRRKLRVVPPDNRRDPIPVPSEVVLHYWATLRHLGDVTRGHISSRHPVIKGERQDNYGIASRDELQKHIADLKDGGLRKGDAIYIEYEQKSDSTIIVRSIGHHFRYRLRYLDSVRTRWKGWDPNKAGGVASEPRGILVPTKGETTLVAGKKPSDKKPSKLTGARLLFGYAQDEGADSGTKGIGEGNYKRLAGRIAFNIGVEQVEQGKTPKERFLNHDKGFLVPLKTLGMPRPSAVECYLQQKPAPEGKKDGTGLLVTYGDLPNDGRPGGELKGRKFYLHQPDARKHATCYESENDEEISGNQAPLAMYVSKPGTRFRFTVRFRDLRPWELGCLLLALDPNQVEDLSGGPREFVSYLQDVRRKDPTLPSFALKLGHGRPLGMGSVNIDVRSLLVWDSSQGSDEKQIRRDALEQFWRKISEEVDPRVLVQWFKVHQYRGLKQAEFPRHDDEIFNFHTELRRQHAEARRKRGQTPNPCVLKPL